MDVNLLPGHETIAYLDPPYNQHAYGSNYHVLHSVSLWDKPAVPYRPDRSTTTRALSPLFW